MNIINAKCDPATLYGVGLLDTEKHYSISGEIKQLSAPIPCRVRLFEKISGKLIADIETDENGKYRFSSLAKRSYFIIAHHPQSQFNAVIQDNVVPK